MFVSSIILDKPVTYQQVEKELKKLFPKREFQERNDDEYAPNNEYISVSVNSNGNTFGNEIVFWDFAGEETGEREIYIAKHLCKVFGAAAIVEAEIDDEDYTEDSAVLVYNDKLYAIDASELDEDDFIPEAQWEIVIGIRKFDEEGLPVEKPKQGPKKRK